MHVGKDTEFYIKKGFDVVAVEANPGLVKAAKSKFHDELASGSLVIWDIAIADHEGEVEFYINEQKDDWSTISKEFADKYERLGTSNRPVKVKCTRFENILKKHGIPYYLKIDIEGADKLCLEGLKAFNEKPKYLSIEAGLKSSEDSVTELSLLKDLGYNKFKIVNQAINHKIKCQNPPLEGLYVDFHFDGHCSGPFGDEAPGTWMTIKETRRKYRRIIAEQKYFGADGIFYQNRIHKLYESILKEPIGWYDIHAKHADG